MNKLIINIDDIISSGLGFESYFILYCVYYKLDNLIKEYATKCKKINTELFQELVDKELLVINTKDLSKIYFEYLSLSEKGAAILRNSETPPLGNATNDPKSENNFESFRQFYPKRVRKGSGYRPLHTDLKRCRQLYDKLCMETTHDVLCKCAVLYHQEHLKSNSEEFMQNLATWLHQKNYQIYLDEAIQQTNIKQIEETNTSNLDAI